jgi:sugar phosphate isomerase/epimerase
MATSADTIPLSLAHLSELDVPPLELVELAARAGFASIGLRTSPASPGGVEYPLRTPAVQAEMRRRLAANGVSVLEVEMVPLSEATRVADYRSMLEAGAAIGASRLTVGGDSVDFSAVAEKLAEMCELARPYGIAVDLEFMPFRPVRSLADAVDVLRRARHPNAHILIDALHVFRSNSALEQFANIDPAMIGPFQICDAPATPPAPERLVMEARTRRLLPGHGELALSKLIDALPPGTRFSVEVPLASQRPALDAGARLAMLVSATREFLRKRAQ